MRTALANSRNIPAVQAMQQVDKEKVAEFVHALGIDYGDELYESYAIGGGFSVNPLQMAAAYGAFARGGYYIEPYSYTKITFKDTNEVLEQKPKREKVMSEETAYMINSMLVTAQEQKVGGDFTISGSDIAAKTGTSTYDSATLKKYNVPLSTSADNWDITYSPDYVISLWYGYEYLSHDYYTDPIKANTARRKIMSAIAKKIYKTNSKFTKPSNVVSLEVEKESVPLSLPSDSTPSDMRMTELFRSGTEPTETSTRYSQLENPTNGSGKITGNSINLSWDGIITPSAIDTSALQNYFNEYYKTFAQTYYEKRIAYNNSYIGTLGYNIYLEKDGNQTLLGFTNNTSYTYNASSLSGTYKFIIKSAYSIFKSNMSSGLTITVTSSNSDSSSESFTVGSIVVSNPNMTKSVASSSNAGAGAYFSVSPITVKDTKGNDVTSKVNVSITVTKDNQTYKTCSSIASCNIDQSIAATYKVTYKVGNIEASGTITVK